MSKMSKEIDKKELAKHIRNLNKKKLCEKIKTTGDIEDLKEDFITAIEDIDDDGKIGNVPNDIIDYYESILPEEDVEDDENGEDEELEDKLVNMSLKELREFAKDKKLDIGRITKRNMEEKVEEIIDLLEEQEEDDGDDDSPEFDADALLAKLEDMDIKEVREFAKENDLDIGRITKRNLDDKIEEIIDAMEEKAEEQEEEDDGDDDSPDFYSMDEDELFDFCDENDIPLTARQEEFEEDKLRELVKKKYAKIEGKAGADKKTGADKKADKEDKEDDGKLPGKLRKGTSPGDIYEAVRDNPGITLQELATPWAKKQNKKPHQVFGWVNRTLVRIIAKNVKITATYPQSGEDGDTTYEVEDY